MPLGLFALAIGGFGIGLTEFVILGLLPEVAATYNVTEAAAGWLITGYALSVAVGALALTAAVTRLPRKQVLVGLLVLFMLNFHHIVIRSLVDSYTTIPLAEGLNPRRILITLTDTLSATFMIVLRLMSPFLVYGIMFNVAVGMINKMAPQIPVYFISTPYALMGGIFLLYLGIASMIEEFVRGFPLVFTGL